MTLINSISGYIGVEKPCSFTPEVAAGLLINGWACSLLTLDRQVEKLACRSDLGAQPEQKPWEQIFNPHMVRADWALREHVIVLTRTSWKPRDGEPEKEEKVGGASCWATWLAWRASLGEWVERNVVWRGSCYTFPFLHIGRCIFDIILLLMSILSKTIWLDKALYLI